MKILLEKGKLLEKEWNSDDSNLNSRINDWIYIEIHIKKIIEIYEIIGKCNSQKINIIFMPDKDDQINKFLEKIKVFGEVINEDMLNCKEYKNEYTGLFSKGGNGCPGSCCPICKKSAYACLDDGRYQCCGLCKGCGHCLYNK